MPTRKVSSLIRLVFMLASFAPVGALKMRARVSAMTLKMNATLAHRQPGAVCISLPVYEDSSWITILVQNALKFTDCSTKVALHLDNATNYSAEDIQKFNEISSRVSVNPERVEVKWATGSILHAHVLNALHMQRVWGNQCSYYVLQASNMLWIKPGMESFVEEFHISGMYKRNFDCFGFCRQQGWRGEQQAWDQPEGMFVPMALMNSFTKDYMVWFRTLANPDADFLHAKHTMVEEFWLQTYASVHEDRDLLPGPKLCERVMFHADPLTVEQVQEMIKGTYDTIYKQKFPEYYAQHEDFCNHTDPESMAPFSVKVNSHGEVKGTRDPDNDVVKWLDLVKHPYQVPIIQYIIHLTNAAPSFSEGTSCDHMA